MNEDIFLKFCLSCLNSTLQLCINFHQKKKKWLVTNGLTLLYCIGRGGGVHLRALLRRPAATAAGIRVGLQVGWNFLSRNRSLLVHKSTLYSKGVNFGQ